MGCHSGKASSLQPPVGKPASPDGTLLGTSEVFHPSSPKNSFTSPSEQGAPAKSGSMIVTEWHKTYSTYEGLARALKVYDAGWVSGFNDVRNGDTGTLLAEVTSPADAVAIRIHRHGGIVCMARAAVELAGFNGVWIAQTDCPRAAFMGGMALQFSQFRSGGDIRGDVLTLLDGNISQIKVEETKMAAGSTSSSVARLWTRDGMTYAGASNADGTPRYTFVAELRDDDKIYWEDSSVWSRHLGPPPLPQPADALKGAEAAVLEGPAQGSETAVLESTPQGVKSDAKAPVHSNRIQTVEDVVPTPAQVITDKAADSSRGVASGGSNALFPSVAPFLSGGSGIEKQPRKERTTCCC